MNLKQLDVSDAVLDFIEHGNYDGIAVIPHQAVACPVCGQPAVIVEAWLGGHGRHNAYRCSADRNHQGPVFWSPAMRQWILGEYVHFGFTYRIVPKAELEATCC